MHLLEDFEQCQQAQPGSFAPRRMARPFKFVGQRRALPGHVPEVL
jgi:hypothetical protein